MRANHSERAWRYFAVLLSIGATLSGSRSATGQPATPQNRPVPTFSVTTLEVELDVLVTDANGKPVTGGAVGALEVSADQVKLGVAGAGLKNELEQRSRCGWPEKPAFFEIGIPLVNGKFRETSESLSPPSGPTVGGMG
jgi:hypothetical protein